MTEKMKTAQFIPMTSTQAAIGGGVLIGSFALWFLWAAVGESVVCWIESHPGMASWVQAIGSVAAISVTAYIARRDGLHRLNEQNYRNKIETRKIKFHLFKTEFWNSFSAYISIYKSFSNSSKNIKYSHGYDNLYVMAHTIRNFGYFRESFCKISEDDKYILQLSEVGDEFTHLFSVINMIEQRYEVFLNIAKEALNYKDGMSFQKIIKSNDVDDLISENESLKDVRDILDDLSKILSGINSEISKKLFHIGN